MQSIVCANGTRLAYVELGSPTAEPVVFLHGFTGTAHSHFAAELALLAPHMHVYGLELRGYGASAPPYRVFGADFYERDARDVISFIETLDIGPVHLVGFSDGSEAAKNCGLIVRKNAQKNHDAFRLVQNRLLVFAVPIWFSQCQ